MHLNIESLFGDIQASFHDSTINRFNVDFLEREVKLECSIYVADLEDKDPTPEMADGVLSLTGLLYISIEPPYSDYSYEDGGLDISYDGPVETTDFKGTVPNLPKPLPPDAFEHCFYISNWNSFLFVAATGAKFEWK